MERYLIGIDVGTTGTKALLFSESGKLLAHAYRGYPLSAPRVGWSEQLAEDWWQAVVETVREICPTEEIGHRVAAISLSTQGGTIVPTDAQGNALRPSLVWNDARGAAEKEKFLREVGGDDIMYGVSGWHLGNGLPALLIRWIKDNQPEIFEKAAFFLSVPDYVSMKMTGIPAADKSNVGINQLYDIRKGHYCKDILEFAGIREEQLPKVVSSGETIGHLTEEAAKALGLTTEAVLVGGAHDQYAVALGAGATKDGDILIGSGTCWVVTAIGNEPDFESGLAQSVAAVPGKWGSILSLSTGGVCLDWLRKEVAEESGMSYAAINETLHQRDAAKEDLFFFPFTGKAGESRKFSKASFTGLDLSHDRFHMAKAVMEGVAFQALWMMESFRAKPTEAGIILSGGASKSPVWTQLVADISGLPVRIPEVADLACVGAAIMAGAGSGVFETLEDGYRALAVKERQVMPDLQQTKEYAPLVKKYRKQAEILGQLYEEE